MIEAYGAAAGRAKVAGFDGVQIHAGHGYLISQFLSGFTNRRNDGWGGDVERRRRFLMEVYNRVRREVGPNYPVLIKMNTRDYVRHGLTPEEAIPAAQALANAGIDAIELSGGFTDSVFNITRGEIPLDAYIGGFSFAQRLAIKAFFRFMQDKVRFDQEAYYLPDALMIRQAVPNVVMGLVGGMRSRAVMESVGYMLRENVELLEQLGLSVPEIYAVGGGATSSLWNSIKADITGKPVIVTMQEEAASLGAAMLGAVAGGWYRDVETAWAHLKQDKRVYAPNDANREVYDRGFRHYRRLYSCLRDFFLEARA